MNNTEHAQAYLQPSINSLQHIFSLISFEKRKSLTFSAKYFRINALLLMDVINTMFIVHRLVIQFRQNCENALKILTFQLFRKTKFSTY